jgi:hypothetical protein
MVAFCIGSITVARLLERNLGARLFAALLVESARVSALEEEHFNMVKSGYRGCFWFSRVREAINSKFEPGFSSTFLIRPTRDSTRITHLQWTFAFCF